MQVEEGFAEKGSADVTNGTRMVKSQSKGNATAHDEIPNNHIDDRH